MESKSEINIYEILKYLLKYKKIILSVTILSLIMAAIYNFIILKPIFIREVGIIIPGEFDDRNLYNIILILETTKGKDSFVGAKNVTGSTIVNLHFENYNKEALQNDSDEFTSVALKKIDAYIENSEKIKQNRKNIEEVKQNLKFLALNNSSEKEFTNRLASISKQLDEKKIISQAIIFSKPEIDSKPKMSRKLNSIAAFTIFGCFAICSVLLVNFYREH